MVDSGQIHRAEGFDVSPVVVILEWRHNILWVTCQ